MKPKLYLAGAINGKSDEEANAWRQETKRQLADLYEYLDPMDRDYRGQEEMHVADIIDGDLADINSCDVMLVRGESPSWGTAMEVRYAYAEANKRVVVFGAGPRPSPWLAGHAEALFADLPAALTYLTQQWRPLWEGLNQ